MTTPTERTRALRVAGELLQHLEKRQDIPLDLRVRAREGLHNLRRSVS